MKSKLTLPDPSAPCSDQTSACIRLRTLESKNPFRSVGMLLALVCRPILTFCRKDERLTKELVSVTGLGTPNRTRTDSFRRVSSGDGW